ncbi:MAG: DUF2085 domain-containing protein [Candidatus Thorarchaeota archaeon]
MQPCYGYNGPTKTEIRQVWGPLWEIPVTSEQEPRMHPDELEIDASAWTSSEEIRESLHVMLSHHPPSMYGHCLRVSFRGRSLYLCGRCAGIYTGLGLGLGFLFLVGFNRDPSWFWFFVSLAIGFSTVVDWISQRLTPRKTTNTIRAASGFLSGASLAMILYLANLLYMLVALIVMGTTIGGVGFIENRRRQRKKTTLDDDGE